MMVKRTCLCLAAALLFVTVARAQGQGDDRVFRFLTTDQIEELLSGQKIEFKKTAAITRGIHYYDFNRGGFNVRLTYFDGKDLMLDGVFKPLPLEAVNKWNRTAKFSRASLHKDDKGEFLMLENNLDVLGGITAGGVRQFVTQFEIELKNFDRFITEHRKDKVTPAPGQNKMLAQVDDQAIEGILRGMNVIFKKAVAKNGVSAFDFNLNGMNLRLTNFGGRDLMIDGVFKKLNLEAINKYNTDRKFIRAVAYNNQGNEYTALECNLDCAAGVTEGMIRHFITAFSDDAKHFSAYAQNQQ